MSLKPDPGDIIMRDGMILNFSTGLAYRDKTIGICRFCNEKTIIQHMGCGLWVCRKEECKSKIDDKIEEFLKWQRQLYVHILDKNYTLDVLFEINCVE